MNAIQNFAFEEHLVRVVDRDGNPWFVGKDVCNALGIGKHRDALATLDQDERASSSTDPLGRGGAQEMTIVSEPGVYRLVFRSRKPEAERFKRWLAHEVLPAIRRTGGYGAPQAANEVPAPEDREGRALRMVTEARLIFGKAAAARLWGQLGLPAVPPPPADMEPEACLQHLLDADTGHGNVAQLLAAAFADTEGAAKLLADCGVRAGDGTFIVATGHPFLRRLFRPTRWKPHYRYLRGLEGAEPARVMKFGRHVSRGVELPAFYAEGD